MWDCHFSFEIFRKVAFKSSDLLDEFDEVLAHFFKVRLVQVEHVTSFIPSELNGLAPFVGDIEKVGDAILHVGRGRCEIGVTAHDENLKVGILTHGILKVASHVEHAVAGAPVPGADIAGEDFVGMMAFPAKVAAEVVVDGGGKSSVGNGIRGIVAGVVFRGIGGGPGDSGVEAAEDLALIAQEFLPIAGGGQAEVAFNEEGSREAGELFKLSGDGFFFFGGNVRSLE